MPTEGLKFEDLLKEYIEVIENNDVRKLRQENEVIKVDIERKQKESEGIDVRIAELQSELDSLNENSTVKLEYPEAIKDKEDKIQEAKNFKEKKLEEIKQLKDTIKENNKQIIKVNNIGKDVINKAEEKIAKENEKIEKKIEELKERKAKYGIKRQDEDGKESIQLTKEEKLVIDSIDKDIKKLNKEIRDNKKALLLFKKAIEDAKKDKEAFIALKNKVKGKEEPKKEEPKEKPAQEKNNEQKPEKAKEEPKKTDGIAHEEILGTPTGKTSERTDNNNPTPKPTGKTEKKKGEEPVQEQTREKEENTDKPSREGKVEYKGKVIPEDQQPEHEIHEVKDPVLEKYENDGFGKNAFGWYFNPWISEYDENYDPHNDKEYNEKLNKKLEAHEGDNKSQDEVEIPEPVVVEPETEQLEPTKPQKTEPEREVNNSEYDVFTVNVSPLEDRMTYRFENLKDKVEIESEDTKGLKYSEKEIEDYIKVLREYDDIEKIEKAIDPNILRMLVENDKSGKGIELYLDMLRGKDVAFKLKYSLKGIYDSNLDRKQIKNLIKISKAAERLSKGSVEVEKDNIFTRAYGNIRKMLEEYKQEKLDSSKEAVMEKDEDRSTETVEEIYEPRHAKVKEEYEPKHAKPKTSIISKAKSIAVSAGKETIGGIRILGTRLTGFLTRENKLATESKVRTIRESSFVPKVKVDEKKAIEKVKASKNEDKPLDISWLKEGLD